MKIFKHLLSALAILGIANSAVAQTTVNLADQCNCEVFKSATEVNPGATTPAGADTGDLLIDPSGDLFFWDGDSWEIPTAAQQSEPWFDVATNTEATLNTQNIYQLGNVGIGTDSPTSRLTVSGDGATDATNGIRLENGLSRSQIFQNADTDLVIQKANQANQLVLNSDGRVGINTDEPTAKLDVDGFARVRGIPAGDATNGIVTTDADGNLRQRTAAQIVAAGGGGADGDAWGVDGEDQAAEISRTGNVIINNDSRTALTLKVPNNEDSVGLAFQNSGEFYNWNMFKTSGTTPDLVFSGGVSGTLESLPERMRIAQDGRVGINTDEPTARLDVEGGARVRGIPAGAAADGIVTTDADGNLRQRTAAEIVAAGGGAFDNLYTANGTLTGERTVTFGGNDLTFNVADNGTTQFKIDDDRLTIGRDAGNNDYSLITSKANMIFIADNNNNSPGEGFNWGMNANQDAGTGDANYDELMTLTEGTGTSDAVLDLDGSMLIDSDGTAGNRLRFRRRAADGTSGGFSSIGTYQLNATQQGLVLSGNGDAGAGNNDHVFIEQNSGDVGVGTDAPDAKLHVNGGWLKVANDDAGFIELTDINENKNWYIVNDRDFSIRENTLGLASQNPRLVINEGGNIGVDVATPAVKFDIRDDNAAILRLSEPAQRGGAIQFGNASHGLKRAFDGTANDVGLYTTSGDLFLSTNGESTGEFVLADNGRVGIGIVTPTQPLDVIRPDTDNAVAARFGVLGTPIDGDQGILLRNNAGGWIGYKGTSTSLAMVAGDGKDIEFYTQSATMASNPSVPSDPGNVKRMTIETGSGRVGIGTDSPQAKLDVEGSIMTATQTFPDYVFEAYETGESALNKTYEFKSLAEVETFIKLNKHLPGVTGIGDLKKNKEGKYKMDISTISVQTLEKVEELFLYTIEQNKKIDSLTKENEELKGRLDKIEAMLNIKK